jgi:VCBS repeat-containing protein
MAYLYKINDNGTVDASDDTWTLVSEIAPPPTDDGASDLFGQGVAISEDGLTIAIGAPSHEQGGRDQGAVYVYSFDGDSVTLEGRLRAADRTDSDQFGRHVSLSADGSVLITGALSDDDVDSAAGAAHVYTASGGDWNTFFNGPGSALQNSIRIVDSNGVKLTPISEVSDAQSDQFGRFVAVSDDGLRLAVGAYDDDHAAGLTLADPDNDGGGTWRDRGSVYVYGYDSVNLHTVIDPDIAGGENGKGQLAVQATVASGINHVEIITGTGALSVAETVAGTVTITLASGGSTANEIVAAVASAGITGFSVELFLGNGAANAGGNDGTALLTLAHASQELTNWELQQKIVGSNTGQDDRFGYGVDIDGDTLVVGANQEDSNSATANNNSSSNSGSVYIFEFEGAAADGSKWSEVQRIKAPDLAANDHFGRSVSIDGDVIVVSSYLEDTGGTDAGSVYVFQKDTTLTPGSQWGVTDIIRSPYGESRDNFGLDVAISGDDIIVGAWRQDRILSDGTVISQFGGAHGYKLEAPVTVTSVDTTGTLGSVTINPDGFAVTYDPGTTFDDLDVGDTATDTFTYEANGKTVSVTVTITGANDAVIAVADTGNAVENGPEVTITVADNDTDVDDSSVAIILSSATSAKGAVTTVVDPGGPGQAVSYDPTGVAEFEALAVGETTTDTFTYFVTDNQVHTDPAAVTLDANDLNPGTIRLQTGGIGVAGTWGNAGSTATISVVAGDLTYPKYNIAQTGTGQAIQGGYNNVRSMVQNITSPLSGEVWFSYLVQTNDADDLGGISLNDDLSGASSDFEVVARGTDLLVDLPGTNVETVATGVFTLGETALVLGRINTTDGTIAVWVNPDLTSPGNSLLNPTWEATGTFAPITAVGVITYNDLGTEASGSGAAIVDAIRLDNDPYPVAGFSTGTVTMTISTRRISRSRRGREQRQEREREREKAAGAGVPVGPAGPGGPEGPVAPAGPGAPVAPVAFKLEVFQILFLLPTELFNAAIILSF